MDNPEHLNCEINALRVLVTARVRPGKPATARFGGFTTKLQQQQSATAPYVFRATLAGVYGMPEDRSRRTYQPGQTVPTSGIYTAVHQSHRSPHEVVAIQGEEFPPCRECRDGVRFHIARLVPHMTHDFDLTGPPSPEEVRAKAAGKGKDN